MNAKTLARFAPWILGGALTVAAAGALAGCSRKTDAGAATEDAGQALDTPVMAFLSEARARHHEASVLESKGDAAGAVAALRKLASAPVPHPGTRVPEVDEVLADTHARIAELLLGQGGDANLAAASDEIRAGLEHAPEPTYFRGHLLEVDGIVEEARAATLADAGKKDDAERARGRALARLHEAVEIQERVIADSIGDGGNR